MIIINDRPGQLCNRLWGFSFFIAFALKHNVKVYIPYFREYRSQFENLSSFPNIHFAIFKYSRTVDLPLYYCYRLAARVLRKVGSYIDLTLFGVYIDSTHWTEESWDSSLLMDKGKVIFLGSWLHPKEVAPLLEYKAEIIRLFEPRRIHKERVDSLFTKLRSRFEKIIGVHIRRRDYRSFHGGAYFFDDSVYKRYMTAMQRTNEGEHLCFFVATDEDIQAASFDGFNIARLEAPAMVEDLYGLSRCDYIFGPPSTFSMWASFVGDVPLRILKYRDENIHPDQFSPIVYQNVFRNGEHFRHGDENPLSIRHEKSFID
ncbi:MAG TPA: hypothetical protein VMF88_06740 [Bacteroidota bacterium]|nr:hypothetical protein [Bacteroidota bacterium]